MLAVLEGREPDVTAVPEAVIAAFVTASRGMWAGDTSGRDALEIGKDAIAASARVLAAVVDDWEDFSAYLRREPRREVAMADYAADVWHEEYEAGFRAAWTEVGLGPMPAEWRAHFIASFREEERRNLSK